MLTRRIVSVFCFVFLCTGMLPIYVSAQLPLPLWAKNLGGTGDSKCAGMQVDKSKNIYITGYFRGTADFDPTPASHLLTSRGDADIYIAKYSSEGQLIWAKSIGGTELDQPNSLALNDNGNVVVVGQYKSPLLDADPSQGVYSLSGQGSEDAFVIRLDSDGDFLWAKSLGAGSTDRGACAATDKVGNVYVTGYYSGTVSIDGKTLSSPGGFNGFAMKFTAAGEVEWVINLGGAQDDELRSVAVDSEGNVVLSGYFNSSVNFNPLGNTAQVFVSQGHQSFVAKYSPAGEFVWINRISGSLFQNGSMACINLDDDIYLSGAFGSEINFNPGVSSSQLPVGVSDLFIVKYSSSGEYKWAKTMGGMGSNAFCYQISTDVDRDVYITGYFDRTIDFNSNPSVQARISSHGSRDLFLGKYDKEGNFKWAFSAGSALCNGTLGIELSLDSDKKIYLGGSVCRTVDFDPSNCAATNITSINGTSDSFIAKYEQDSPASVTSKIIAFSVPGQVVPASIDHANARIEISVPAGVDISNLTPEISLDNQGIIFPSPETPQDFSEPVNYVVETNCSALTYTVTVTALPAVDKVITVCEGSAESLEGDVINDAGVSFLWQIFDQNVWVEAPGMNSLADYHIADLGSLYTRYSIRRKVVNEFYESHDSFYTVNFYSSPPANSINAGHEEVCGGRSTEIIVGGDSLAGYTSDHSFQWQTSNDAEIWYDIPVAKEQNLTYFTQLSQPTYFRRVIFYGFCASYSNSVLINVSNEEVQAHAGPDQLKCNQSIFRLTAQPPKEGQIGEWTVIAPQNQGFFTIDNPNHPGATISGIPIGLEVQLKWSVTGLKWSVTGCSQKVSDTLKLKSLEMPLVDAGKDVLVNLGESIAMAPVVRVNSAYIVNWFPSIDLSNPKSLYTSVSPSQSRWYYLTVTSGSGCSAMDSIFIDVMSDLVIPNAFTPNGDGVNDLWNIENIHQYKNSKILVYSRFGELVYISSNYSKAWDGSYNGRALPPGIYFYILTCEDFKLKKSGSLTIIY